MTYEWHFLHEFLQRSVATWKHVNDWCSLPIFLQVKKFVLVSQMPFLQGADGPALRIKGRAGNQSGDRGSSGHSCFVWLNAQWRKFYEIFTSATQPLWQSGWVAAPATLAATVAEWLSGWVPEWLRQSLWQSGWVAAPATLAEWLRGWVPAWQSGWVAEWLRQPLWQSAWVAEWLLQPLWQSGWVAASATLAERLSGWVAAAESSINEMDKVFKRVNIQARFYDIDSNLIYKDNPVNFNCHSYITSTDWLRTATYTLWTKSWNHLKRKIVVMNSTSSGLETTITTTIWWAKNG